MKTSIIENKKIAIIGGGPVGLTTARILQINGADVTVYERDINAQARTSGGTLDIHSNSGQLAIQKAGLMEEFLKYARPTGEKMADMDGNITSDEMPDETNAFSRPEIDRNDLRKIMLDNLEENTVVWNSQLINIEKTENQYFLEFKNGKTAVADFVIVANGGRSNARKFVSDQEPQLSGTYIIQGEISNPDQEYPEFKPKYGNGNVMAMGDHKMFYTHTMRDGSVHFGVSFKADENWILNNGIDFEDDQAVISFLNEKFKNWGDDYKKFFTASSEFSGLPLRLFSLEEPWKQHSNITLVGDAAHLMPPFAGEGVNMGLFDAYHLTKNLTEGKFETIDDAIADYEKKMFGYALEAQRMTKKMEDLLHSDIVAQDILDSRF
ncbi:tetracycline resistance protein [Flavobacterium sp. Root935]|uniref:FAD-dependent oxidoreductase n=1 Tax=unclassified Flavobacterium TaxID=196869 RepID=UPI00070B062F|nr:MULTISPECIES: NAD(P)/FAD-dependent oxidoreductase [unclassified Flavobacterium]KRD58559.1 tetracycline resistance protein [Flavobacterium sp. Root935]TDX11402.1 2-polyprenyl-6-methoxyphenol hydroxylase-like FAD-dependent oxidoreductase [Flavobacterium sp. S87F.05.LMB.W.Kidney.N]